MNRRAKAVATTGENSNRTSSSLKPFFTVTILLSACLLFLVQPLFARMALPLLGGTPTVWAVAMCFFQGTLLVGYAYAHFLRNFTPPLFALIIHSLVLFAAFAMLPFSAPVSSEPISGISAGVTLIWLYTKSIGFPFFALSATAPLLQSWFGRTHHAQASNPYFLYAASNIGSIGALLVYPLLIEPLLGLESQARIWTFMFSILMIAITVCGHLHLQNQVAPNAANVANGNSEIITAGRRFYWVVMAFVPSALLVAWTNYLTADIASAPFLWLPPLVMFLLTFVLEFRDRPFIRGCFLAMAQGLSVPMALVFQFGLAPYALLPAIAVSGLAFMASALICHRQLYNSRPSAGRLTEFYMLMSIGGVCGGLFVSIISPLVFTTNIEYPLLLITALVLRQKLDPPESKNELPFSVRSVALVLAVVVGLFTASSIFAAAFYSNPLELAVLGTIPVILLMKRLYLLAVMAACIIPVLMSVGRLNEVTTIRNYFGILNVQNVPDTGMRLLRHGTTVHGAQRLAELASGFSGLPQPLTYYTRTGGITRALVAKQDQLRLAGKSGAIGVIGLGTGAMSCYRRANEDWTFFEINPDMISIAQNPHYFTFLSKCGSGIKMVEGDARITIAAQPAKIFDYLLIDAFTSDSIPTHLLTVEAVQAYKKHMKHDGLIVFHLSNRFMDLLPYVAATVAKAEPSMQNRVLVDQTSAEGGIAATPSVSMVFSTDQQVLEMIDKEFGAKHIQPPNIVGPWTDDFTNTPAAILRQFTVGTIDKTSK